jgi:hypothetical protein
LVEPAIKPAKKPQGQATVSESNSSHSFKRGVMLNLVAVQVDHREAQFVVSPNQFAVFKVRLTK